MSLTEQNILKSRSGVYKDNAENRRLRRVGRQYGDAPKAEEYKVYIDKYANEFSDLKGKYENYAKLTLRSQRRLQNQVFTPAYRDAEKAGNMGARGKIYTLMEKAFKHLVKEEEKFAERNSKHNLLGLNTETTSMEEFKDKPERVEFRKKIISDYVNRASKQGSEPVAVFMSGGAGSGKSTVMKLLKAQDKFYGGVLSVDSDEIKMKPFFDDFSFYDAQEEGSAARRLHEESSIVADGIIAGVKEKGADFLQDGTLKTYENAKEGILDAKKKGYKTRIIGVTIPVEEAIRRAEERRKRTGRNVPKEIVIKTHTGSTATFLQLIEDGIVDDMVLWDNSGEKPILIYDSKQNPPIIDEKLFNEYKAKKDFVMAKENIEKSYNFGASEFNREAKRLAQERLKQGLPVSVDIPNDADAKDLAMLNAFDKWLRDGQPVE